MAYCEDIDLRASNIYKIKEIKFPKYGRTLQPCQSNHQACEILLSLRFFLNDILIKL